MPAHFELQLSSHLARLVHHAYTWSGNSSLHHLLRTVFPLLRLISTLTSLALLTGGSNVVGNIDWILMCTCTCATTARTGHMEATGLVAPLAVGTPASSQLHGLLGAVGVIICGPARPMRWERWGTAFSDGMRIPKQAIIFNLTDGRPVGCRPITLLPYSLSFSVYL